MVVLAQWVRDFDFREYPSLTLPPRMSWLSLYAISIFYRISESDTLPTVVLAQFVRYFDFLENIRV